MDFIKLMDKEFKDVKLDSKLDTNLKLFIAKWSNKNDTNVEYLSSGLVGVYPIRFTTDDNDDFFENILNIVSTDLQKDLYKIKGIEKDRKVTSNVLYLTCVYLMYKTHKSSLSLKMKNSLVENLYIIMIFGMVSSIVFHYFKYNLDKDVAMAVYNKLSNKYLIKRLGTWLSLFKYRSSDVKSPDGLHMKRFKHGKAKDITEIVADIQGRYRSIHKELYVIIDEVITEEEKRLTTSLNGHDLDGNDTISEVYNLPASNYNYIFNVIGKPDDFIRLDIITIVDDIFPNVKKDELIEVLKFISENYSKYKKDIDSLIDSSLSANLSYLHAKEVNPPYDQRVVNVIRHLKGLWSSSRVTDPNVKKAKKLVYKFAKVTGKRTPWLLVNLGMAVNIYIFIRTLLKDK